MKCIKCGRSIELNFDGLLHCKCRDTGEIGEEIVKYLDEYKNDYAHCWTAQDIKELRERITESILSLIKRRDIKQ